MKETEMFRAILEDEPFFPELQKYLLWLILIEIPYVYLFSFGITTVVSSVIFGIFSLLTQVTFITYFSLYAIAFVFIWAPILIAWHSIKYMLDQPDINKILKDAFTVT